MLQFGTAADARKTEWNVASVPLCGIALVSPNLSSTGFQRYRLYSQSLQQVQSLESHNIPFLHHDYSTLAE